MLKHKSIDRVCAVVLVVTILLTCAITGLAMGGQIESRNVAGYAERLFDTSTVHTIDIVIDDWDAFLETCTSEQYSLCSVVIDGEKCGSVGIRGKGNTSLSNVAQYGNNRYSFKLEFDHYQEGRSYYGLDKLCLNNLIQDATYMKDYLAYTLMNKMGVAAPLCSFVKVNVNGEYWGLYLAVEAVEDAFLTRNYGSESGELYKPDSMSMGGGKGQGQDFRMSDFRERFNSAKSESETAETSETSEGAEMEGFTPPEGFDPSNFTPPEGGPGGGFGGFGFGSDDVKLVYTDDDPDSYANIFENAKTDVNDADKARLIAALKALNEGTDIESTVDVEAVIRYFVVHSFLVNGDSYTGSMIHNYYLYERDGMLSMIPWDYNLSLGGFNMSSDSGTDSATSAVNDPIDTPVSGGDVTSRPMLAWIFADETYTEMYHQIYSAFMAEVYDSGWLLEEIDRVSAMIAPYVETDPTAFFSYEEYEKGVETLKTFVELRCQSVEGQLNGSIPSTTTAQSADGSALIDACTIDLSDMGSMGGGGQGGGGGFPGMPGGSDSSGFPGMPGSSDGNGFPGMPEGMDGFPAMPGAAGDSASIPDSSAEGETETAAAVSAEASFPTPPGGMGEMPGQDDSLKAALPWAVSSLIVLIAGLIFAKRARICR